MVDFAYPVASDKHNKKDRTHYTCKLVMGLEKEGRRGYPNSIIK